MAIPWLIGRVAIPWLIAIRRRLTMTGPPTGLCVASRGGINGRAVRRRLSRAARPLSVAGSGGITSFLTMLTTKKAMGGRAGGQCGRWIGDW